jgi:hypothetical protein
MENAIQVSVDGDYSRYVYDSSAVPTTGSGSGKVKFVATSPSGSPDTTAASGQTVSVAFDMATGMIIVDPGTGVPLAPVPFQNIMGSSYVAYGTGSVNGSVGLRWDASTGRVYIRFYGTNGAITRDLDFNMYSIVERYQGGSMNMTDINNAVNVGSFVQSSGASYATAVKFQQIDTSSVTQGGDNYDYAATYGTNSGFEDVTMYVENTGGNVYDGYSNPAVTIPASPATGYILITLDSDDDISNVTGNGDSYEFLYNFDTTTARAYYNGAQVQTDQSIAGSGSGGFASGAVSASAANYSLMQNNLTGEFIIEVDGIPGLATRQVNIDMQSLLTHTYSSAEVAKYINMTIFHDRTGAAYGTPASVLSYSATPAALPGTVTPTGLANYDYSFDYGIAGHVIKFYIHRGHFAYAGQTTIPAYTPTIPYSPPLVYDPANPTDLTLQDFIDYLLYKEPTPISPTSTQGQKIVSIATAFYPVIRNTLRSAADGKPYSGSIAHALGSFRASIQ